MSIESVMPSNHLILCCPILLLPSIFPSIRVFSNESVLHIRWPKSWNFSISPSNEYSGLISFRMNWVDLLAVQGTLKSLLQPPSSKAWILQQSVFHKKSFHSGDQFSTNTPKEKCPVNVNLIACYNSANQSTQLFKRKKGKTGHLLF